MADAKKCDRCGSVYVKRESSKVWGIPFTAYDDVVQIKDTEMRISKTYDLCNKCLTEFKEKFMNGAQFAEELENKVSSHESFIDENE